MVHGSLKPSTGTVLFFFSPKALQITTVLKGRVWCPKISARVVDRHHIDLDPDPDPTSS